MKDDDLPPMRPIKPPALSFFFRRPVAVMILIAASLMIWGVILAPLIITMARHG